MLLLYMPHMDDTKTFCQDQSSACRDYTSNRLYLVRAGNIVIALLGRTVNRERSAAGLIPIASWAAWVHGVTQVSGQTEVSAATNYKKAYRDIYNLERESLGHVHLA